jgi:hypothetical protein
VRRRRSGLGPANDRPSAVQEEIEALDRLETLEAACNAGFQYGFTAHGRDTDPPEMVGISWRAGWLAREIETHRERDTRDAEAWPWDINRTIAEQQDEIEFWLQWGHRDPVSALFRAVSDIGSQVRLNGEPVTRDELIEHCRASTAGRLAEAIIKAEQAKGVTWPDKRKS